MNPENPIKDGLVEPIGIRKPQKSIKMDRSKKSGRRAKQKPDNSRQSSLVRSLSRIFSGVDPVKIGKHNPMKSMRQSFDKRQAKKKRKRKIAYQSKRLNRMRAA